MLDRIITYSFYLLFLLVSLFWTSLNFELFEYNKMILTYGFTTVIVGAWLLKIINHKSLIFNRTPLDIPLLLFLAANILSTIFSIDTHTSIWGYYSRSNGGLLSIISYLLLYWAFVSNMDKERVFTTLKVGLISGAIISVWAIFEHFGVSLSCVLLRGDFNASCWVQDVQARVFATLGQPNWLAAYLAMLIFPALYFYLKATEQRQRITYYLLLIVYYLAFTFTYSRGPTLGLIGGLIVFLSLYVYSTHTWHGYKQRLIVLLVASFLSMNLLFGSALTSFRLITQFAPPPRPAISLTSQTQLEQGGTESGQIRLIVWQGALDIFKHYPLFGSGVETFAYSYYQFRPTEHNLTSEWDFLYNKAHNEYLNYLATTGILGFGTYMLVIGTFLVWSIKKIIESSRKSLESSGLPDSRLLTLVTLASYLSFLIYNFFLFSVVIIAVFFYLFPALAFVATDSAKPLTSHFKNLTSHFSLLTSIIYRRPLYTKIAKGLVIFLTLYLLFSIFKLWYADTIFAKGQNALDSGNAGTAYDSLTLASQLNQGEPFYRSELSLAAAAAASALQETDASLSASLKDEAVFEIEKVLRSSPNNVSFWRTAIRVYFELSGIDQQYTDKTINALDKAISLAPTDPKLYYNKALILDSINKKQESIQFLQKTLELKPNYLEAITALQEATTSAKP
ncbi:O-antigen ligase family protein [Candidatus Daviesbacteria bacterium]|nr:O-antigen ligase family protein [Candidatus Daviesbacteria bacterium]MBI4035445.1 O-antigen ligase family protein [Candidatus Daviesbacteria bacterium]